MKKGKWIVRLMAVLAAVSLCMGCGGGTDDDPFPGSDEVDTQVNAVVIGVEYRVNSWYTDDANVCRPNDYLTCEVTGYSTKNGEWDDQGMLELRIGARSSANTKWTLEDAGGGAYYFKNVATGKYMSMEDAWWNTSSSNQEWGWNRPLIREKKETADYKWKVTYDSGEDFFFIESVAQTGKKLSMQVAMEKKSEEWANSSVQCREGLDSYGTTKWLFYKVTKK